MRRRIMNHQYLIKTPLAAVLVPTPARVGEYVTDILAGAEQRGSVIDSLHIERRSAEQVALFLGDNGKLAQVSPAERSRLIGLPLDTSPPDCPPPVTTPPAGTSPPAGSAPGAAAARPPKGKALKVLAVIKGLTRDKAATASALAHLAKVDQKSAGELFFRLYHQGRIARVEGVKPFQFYDPATEAQTGTITCPARNGKQIPKDACNPNREHPSCRECQHK